MGFKEGHIAFEGTTSTQFGNMPPWNKNKKGLQIAWNKGLTKGNNPSIAKYALTLKTKNKHWGYRENNPNWNGGKSFEIYPIGWNRTFKEQIRYRDNYKCQICGIPEAECKRRLSVHHRDLDKSNLNEDNLISLCDKCHKELHWQNQKS